MFTDVTTIKVQAGKGGDGYLSFHRTRGNAKGGPDGGDGGNGGNVVMQASHNTNTLAKYRTSNLWRAEDGMPGGTNKRHGKSGEDIVIIVPPGTIISQDGQPIADLKTTGEEVIVALGGEGGFGNHHFKSSVRQAPQMAELGEEGEAKELVLELKLVADVGLVGLPNAGKSTLLSIVSNAKPEIADYAFTTLIPNLGVVDVDDSSFLMADIPGLIEGASEGKGLGDEFLRHVERCKILLHLIDVNSLDMARDYKTIRTELKHYKTDLSKRPSIVAITKIETKPRDEVIKIREMLAKSMRISPDKIHLVSAVSGDGIVTLLRACNETLVKASKVKKVSQAEVLPVITIDPDEGFTIQKDGDVFEVSGKAIERFARRTNFSQPDGLRRLRDILKKTGITKELSRAGASTGSILRIAGKQLEL